MVKLKDLIKIMPNPTEFYLCILDEYGNAEKAHDSLIYNRCTTYDFKSFSFYYHEDEKDHSSDRILELLEYEVTCIRNYVHNALFTNGGRYEWNGKRESMENFFVYIDKPLQKNRKD